MFHTTEGKTENTGKNSTDQIIIAGIEKPEFANIT